MAAQQGKITDQSGSKNAKSADEASGGIQGLIANAKSLAARVQAMRPLRVFKSFNDSRGNLLAAGMSYQALFAIFAAIWLVFAVAGLWLTSSPELLHSLINLIDRAAPGLIGKGGAISEESLVRVSGTLGWTGIIAAVGLLFTAIGWLDSTRKAVRSMFSLGDDHTNFVMQKLRDLGLAFGFGLLLIVAALASLVSATAINGVLDFLGITSNSIWAQEAVQAVSFIVTVALNTVTLAAMYRVLSHLLIPLRNLILAALSGSIVLAVLSTVSGLVLRGASKNPLAASFAVILGLLIWFNLVCRIILFCASWLAVGMNDRGISARKITPEQRELERAEEEQRARIVLAQAAVDKADAAVAASRGIKRRRANRRLERAREHLREVRGDDQASSDASRAPNDSKTDA